MLERADVPASLTQREGVVGACLSGIHNRLINLEVRLTTPSKKLQPRADSFGPDSIVQSADSHPLALIGDPEAIPAKTPRVRTSPSRDPQALPSPRPAETAALPLAPARKRLRGNDTDDYDEMDQLTKRRASEGSATALSPVRTACDRCDSSSCSSRDSPLRDLMGGFSSSDFIRTGMVATLSQKIVSLQRTLQDWELVVAQKDKELLAKDRDVAMLQQEICSLQDEKRGLKGQLEHVEAMGKKGRLAIVRTLRALEEKKRQEQKAQLHMDSLRLGKVTVQRTGSLPQEFWEDGKDIVELKERLNLLQRQKEAMDKQRKQLKKAEDEDALAVLALRLALIQREEADLRTKLDRLEVEKNIYIQESRRMADEDSAVYSKAAPTHEPWPVLHSRYLLLALLGKGGFSEVYRAYDLEEHRELAIKFHKLDPVWSEELKASYIKHALRENLIHKELNHPRIVKHYDTLEVDSSCFCTVLEYCPGEDLHMYLKRAKTLSEKEARLITLQLFQALKYLDDQSERVIHYDLKPHNILLNGGEVKITDFGLSKVMEASKTNMDLTSQGVGTYWYQPPECFETGSRPPKISGKVDVWSAGVILYEMLYGQKPFGHNMPQEKVLREQVIVKATQVSFPAKPAVSAEGKDFIRRCLEYDQDQRWTAAEALAALYLRQK